MTFDFQKTKPILQAEFDAVMAGYPTDISRIAEEIPEGGDPWERKLAVVQAAAEQCPVHIFPHYPYAFEIDCGRTREYFGVAAGDLCKQKSGVDFSPLWQFRQRIFANKLGSFNDYTDYLHRAIDYDKLLAWGFSGVYEDCLQRNKTETDPEKKQYREVVMQICRYMETIGRRLREKAAQMLEEAEDSDVRYNLQRIALSANTPWAPAETMQDALNSLLCIALFISDIDGIAMNCLGHIDRLIYPYYKADLEAGRITKEEGYWLLQCFLYKTDAHIHYNDQRRNYDNGVTVMIGGCDPDGNPVYNEMTDLILDAYRDSPFIQPKLNARAGAYSPREYLLRLADQMLHGSNNLIVENDDYIVPMFQRMGLTAEDARCYIGGGCQEVICRNHLHSRAFTYLNLVQVLLDTLDHACRGTALSEDHRYFYGYGLFCGETYEALEASYLDNLRSYIRRIAEEYAPYERKHPEINPEPILSCFTADCIAEGRDITRGGARYNHKTLALVGFGTLCDSLLALRDAYENGELPTLLDAIANDFSGYESLRQSLQNSSNRFGQSEDADAFAEALSHKLSGVSQGIYNADGIEWHTSLFTYYLFQSLGTGCGATPDGRHAGAPLSRQMNMAKLPDLTSAARSMSRLTHAAYDDVGMFDISLPMGGGEAYRQALADYIRTCIDWKLPVLQTNLVDRQMLLEEKANKGTHPELIVRVCGFSAYFGQLAPDKQDEVIARVDN